MSRVFLPAVLLLTALTSASLATDPNPYDSVLVVYWLTPAQEAQFSAHDSVASGFWGEWQGRDSIAMDIAHNSWPSRDAWLDTDDVLVSAMAAGGAKGLYLLARLAEKHWNDSSAMDAFLVFFDTIPSAGMAQCLSADDCRSGSPWWTSFTYGSKGLVVPSRPPASLRDTFQFCHSDAAVGLGTYNCGRVSRLRTQMTLGALNVEPLVLDSGHTVVEAFVPWEVFYQYAGQAPQLPHAPAANTLCGFAVGYNDLDPGDTAYRSLGWKHKTPWANDSGANYWGDLEFGLGFPTAIATLSPGAPARPDRQNGVPSERFSLRGERLPAASAPALVVTRQADGTSLRVTGIQCGR